MMEPLVDEHIKAYVDAFLNTVGVRLFEASEFRNSGHLLLPKDDGALQPAIKVPRSDAIPSDFLSGDSASFSLVVVLNQDLLRFNEVLAHVPLPIAEPATILSLPTQTPAAFWTRHATLTVSVLRTSFGSAHAGDPLPLHEVLGRRQFTIRPSETAGNSAENGDSHQEHDPHPGGEAGSGSAMIREVPTTSLQTARTRPTQTDALLADLMTLALLQRESAEGRAEFWRTRLVSRLAELAGVDHAALVSRLQSSDHEEQLHSIITAAIVSARTGAARQSPGHSYPILSEERARDYLLTDNPQRDQSSRISPGVRGAGEMINVDAIIALATTLNRLKDSGAFPEKLPPRSPEGGRYETACVPHVRDAFSGISGEFLCDPDFWRVLAITYFSPIINWRFQTTGADALASNFGIGNSGRENMLLRLWLRSQIGVDPETGDDTLALIGDQDLWRSHIFRQSYGNNREIDRALLRLQTGLLDRAPLQTDRIRALAKRLKKENERSCLALLSRTEAEQLVLSLIEPEPEVS